ncbi:Striatin-interacting protein 1, partial [Cichlidogyrus casuarinus]
MEDLNEPNEEARDENASLLFSNQEGDFEFVYNDCDEYATEIAEFYSYSEDKDILKNKEVFCSHFGAKFPGQKWTEVDDSVRLEYIKNLLVSFELVSKVERIRAVRCALYILQGVYGQCELEEDQFTWARHNVYLCIRAGLLQSIIGLLLAEIQADEWLTESFCKTTINQTMAPRDSRKSLFEETRNLRLILSILYTMVETVRDGKYGSNKELNAKRAKLRDQFIEELDEPVLNDGTTTLSIVLFAMVHRFSLGLAPRIPVKKTLLLLWKVRRRMGLPPLTEDTNEVIQKVRASSPPPLATDQAFTRNARLGNRQSSGSQEPRRGSLGGGRQAFEAATAHELASDQLLEAKTFPTVVPPTPPGDRQTRKFRESEPNIIIPRETTIVTTNHCVSSLPWKPKVRRDEVKIFLNNARLKYLDVQVDMDDTTTLIGLPPPIHDAMAVLNAHLYISIAD